jgi:hypothetical protein
MKLHFEPDLITSPAMEAVYSFWQELAGVHCHGCR